MTNYLELHKTLQNNAQKVNDKFTNGTIYRIFEIYLYIVQ